MEIDWEKPYATIYGARKIRYEQGGFNFDASGEEVTEKDNCSFFFSGMFNLVY